MRSQANSSEDFHCTIAQCLFFKHPEAEQGTVLLSGCCTGGGEVTLVTLYDSASIERSIPGNSDFQVLLPVTEKPAAGQKIEIHFKSEKGEALSVSEEIREVEGLVNQRLADPTLSELKKRKLANLLLNERERIHHIKKVTSLPFHMMIDPSWDCTLDCLYCRANRMRKSGYTLEMMEHETFQKIMDRFGDTLIMVHLANWGEPFLNPQTIDFIRTLKAHEIQVNCNSHLNLEFSDRQIEEIVASGLDRIIVSIDGATQETYARYKKNGSLERATGNIKRFLRTRKASDRDTPRIVWQFLLFDWNREELDAARQLADEIGCDGFTVKTGESFENYTPALEDRDISLMDAMNKEFRDQLAACYEDRSRGHQYFGCDNLYQQLVINADGSIHPCPHVFEPKHLFGSVYPFRTLFKAANREHDIFNSPFHKISRGLFGKPPAKECQGYNPCLNCPVITGENHHGHVISHINFFAALALLAE